MPNMPLRPPPLLLPFPEDEGLLVIPPPVRIPALYTSLSPELAEDSNDAGLLAADPDMLRGTV